MNKKRIILYIVCCYMIYWLGRGGYFLWKYDGQNVPITISTQFSPVPTKIAVYIDKELYYKNDSLQAMYTSCGTKLAFGIHRLKVFVDDEVFEECFLVCPIRWIYIEVQKSEDPNYKNHENWFHIEFSNTPIGFM